MKRIPLIALLILCEFFVADVVAQKWIIVGRNIIDPDGFSIVCTQDVTSADIVYITEDEYSSTLDQFITGENITKYTPPASGHTAGEVISFSETASGSNIAQIDGCTSGNCGTVTNGGGSFAIGEIDELYAYSDSDDDPGNGVTEIYCAWFWNNSEGGGEDPTGDFPNSKKFTIIGNIGSVDFKDPLRIMDVTTAIYLDIASYDLNATGNEILSLTEFSMGILPVELIKFSAERNDSEVILKWATASEINNEGFELQHSRNGKVWSKIGFVRGNGNSVAINEYDFVHIHPNNGLNYYRLRQMDLDGAFEYSYIVSVNFQNSNEGSVYPNPFYQSVTVQLPSWDFKPVAVLDRRIEVLDVNGNLIVCYKVALDETNITLDLSKLISGIYILRTWAGEYMITSTQRIIKL